MSSNITIYEIEKYKGVFLNKTCNKWNVKSYSSDSVKKIISKLKDNKGYHIRINDNEKCILYGDIDHVDIQQDKYFFKEFLTDFSKYLNIDKYDVSYTKSIKEGCLSYHWSYNKLYCDVPTMKKIIEEFLFLYPKFNKNKYIDTSIYSNKWFRLPNQTNTDKPLIHIIKRGSMDNFLIHYINKAIEYTPTFVDKKIKNVIIKDKIQTTSINCINCFDSTQIETEKLLNILSIERVTNRQLWIKLGYFLFSLYSYEDGLTIFIEMSKKSTSFVSVDDVTTVYETFKEKKYNINSLHYFAKLDNITEYQKIIKHEFVKEKILNDVIKINRRYLLNINENLDNNDDILIKNINNFIESDIKTFSLKSAYDTGKTQLIKRILDKTQYKRILWVSYRISLTNDIQHNFNDYGFKNYQTDSINSNKLIIQLESLHKLDNNNFIDDISYIPSYDLIVIDEIESILNHFSSSKTINDTSNTFEYLQEIIKNSGKLIVLDGDTSNRTYNYINYFGESINIENEAKFNKRHFEIIEDNTEFINEIYKELDDNKKIVIISQSKRDVESISKDLHEKYENLTILTYTSLSTNKKELENVNKSWKTADVILYSPSIESGVNFDIPHFNRIFGIFSNMSSSQRSFMQMLNRVRKIENNKITILNDKIFKLNDIYKYMTFEDVKTALIQSNNFKMVQTYETIDNKRVKIKKLSNYHINYIYNEVERHNKKPYYFLSLFRDIVTQKGHTFEYIKKDKFQKNKTTNEIYYNLLECQLINYSMSQTLSKMQNQDRLNREEKILLEKYFMCKKLGLDILTLEIIKKFYNKFYLIDNFTYLIDIKNYSLNNDAQTIINHSKTKLFINLIKDLGFNNIFNTKKYISGEELLINFKNIFSNSELYINQKAAKINYDIPYFKFDDKTTSIKQLLGHINTILRDYSLKISLHRATAKNIRTSYYKIEILNDVDELLKYKIEKGYKLIDDTDIFECEKDNLKSLIIDKEEDSDDENEEFTGIVDYSHIKLDTDTDSDDD